MCLLRRGGKTVTINIEHAVGLGITTGLIFVTGVAYGADLFTVGEALLAALISVMLGFTPVATLLRPPHERDLSEY